MSLLSSEVIEQKLKGSVRGEFGTVFDLVDYDVRTEFPRGLAIILL
jgi:hypothetical protein